MDIIGTCTFSLFSCDEKRIVRQVRSLFACGKSHKKAKSEVTSMAHNQEEKECTKKEKKRKITAMPDGIALLIGYKSKMFIRFCPNGQKSIRRLKQRRL